MTARRLLLLAALCAGLLPLAAGAQEAAAVAGPGDVVRITVLRKPELTGEMEVAENGTLIHPLYRGVNVGGASDAEMEGRIRAFLARYEAEPAFVVERLVRVTVSGEVRQPATHLVKPSATVFEAVTRSGGFSDRAQLARVILYRGNTSRTLDMRTPALKDNQPVLSGDVIVVARRPYIFREYVAPLSSLTAAAAAVINLLTK